MQKFYFERAIDLFKIAISVSEIARSYLYKEAKQHNAYFFLMAEEDDDLHHTLEQNLVGGYSGIFTRKHVVDETRLRHADGEICQNILGYDANSLYLRCIGQDMPRGGYVRRLAPHFTPSTHFKCESMFQWMDYISSTENFRILHARNHREVRIGRYLLDGIHPETNTIFEFNGCKWHGCLICKIQPDATMENRWAYTQQRTKYLQEKGYKVVSIWEHEYKQMLSSNADLKAFLTARLPPFYRTHRYGAVTENAILNAVRDGTFFGFLEVKIMVPEDKWKNSMKCLLCFAQATFLWKSLGNTWWNMWRN